MKLKAELGETSITGISLFILRKPEDKIMSTVSLSMNTEIVKYLVDLVNEDQQNDKINMCLAYGCTNKRNEGGFIGEFCVLYYKMFTENNQTPSTNIIGVLRKEKSELKETISDLREKIKAIKRIM